MKTDKINILDYLHFIHPTKEQEIVLKAMQEFVQEKNKLDFMILSGAAGTGKTSITAALIGYLNKIDKPYKVAAPTGRAARILGKKSNAITTTIHSLIYSVNPNKETGVVSFKLKEGVNITPTIYIIDEASMIPKNIDHDGGFFEVERGLIYDLISFIKTANVKNKIILLGDHYQLPPIGETHSSALNLDFMESIFHLKGSSYLLTEVKRQENGSYILENATEIRNAIDEKKTAFPIKGKQSRNIFNAADNYVRELQANGLEKAVSIGVSHKANKLFNDLVRERIFGDEKKDLEPGDLLMVTQNWHRDGVNLYNGDHVELLSVDWILKESVADMNFVPVKIKLLFSEKEIIIDDYVLLDSILAPGGKIENHLENNLRKQRYIANQRALTGSKPSDDRYLGALRLMYGHAITCNKAQGGEWKKVFINTLGIPSLKWQYTAVTRGIEEIETF